MAGNVVVPSGGDGLPSGGDPGDVVVNTSPGRGDWEPNNGLPPGGNPGQVCTNVSPGVGDWEDLPAATSTPSFLFGELPNVPAIAEPLSLTAKVHALTAPVITLNTATGIVFDGTNLWFSKTTANITKRNMATGVETTVALDHAGKAIFVPGSPSYIYVLKTNGNSVYKVNTSTNAVTTIALSALGTALCHLGAYVWITAGARLLKVSVATNAVQTTFPPVSVNSCVSDGLKVWLTAISGEIYGYLPASTAPDVTASCAGNQPTDYPQRITYDGQFLYVAKSVSGDIDVFERFGATAVATIPCPLPLVNPPDLYFDGVNVVAKTTLGLQKLSVESRTFTDVYPIHGTVKDAVTDGAHFWVVYQDATSGNHLIDKFGLNTTYGAVPPTAITVDMTALSGIFYPNSNTPEVIVVTNGAGQVRLPDSTTLATKRFWIENISGSSVTVLVTGGDSFDDTSGANVLLNGQSMCVQSEASLLVWHLVNKPIDTTQPFATNRIGAHSDVSAPVTAVNSQPFMLCHTGAAVTLPDTATNQDGYIFCIVAVNDGVTVDGFNAGQTIGGDVTVTLNTNETLLIVANQNTNKWDILGRNIAVQPVAKGGTGITYSNIQGGILVSDGVGGYALSLPLDSTGDAALTADTILANTSPQRNTVDTTAGPVTVTLPFPTGQNGLKFVLKRISGGVNALTVDVDSAGTIDGALTALMPTQWQSLTFQVIDGNWYII